MKRGLFAYSLYQKSLPLAFAVAFIGTVYSPYFLPDYRLYYFAPFLVIACYQKPLTTTLWYAFFTGLTVDLMSSKPPLGFYGSLFVMSTLFAWRQKKHFFADIVTTLPIMTFLISFSVTVLETLFSPLFGIKMVVSFLWCLTDLVYLPFLDSLFAFAFFIAPAYLVGKPQRRAEEYFD